MCANPEWGVHSNRLVFEAELRREGGLWSNLGDEGGGVSSVMVEITDGRIRHGGGYRRWAAAARGDGRG